MEGVCEAVTKGCAPNPFNRPVIPHPTSWLKLSEVIKCRLFQEWLKRFLDESAAQYRLMANDFMASNSPRFYVSTFMCCLRKKKSFHGDVLLTWLLFFKNAQRPWSSTCIHMFICIHGFDNATNNFCKFLPGWRGVKWIRLQNPNVRRQIKIQRTSKSSIA